MPTNLYGPNDNFDLKTSHVLPAMIRKFHDAKINNHSTVTLWGTGLPMREFLHVDDANAVLFALENALEDYLYNVGTGTDLTIRDLAKIIQKEVGHKGKVVWDKSKPDGTPRKLLDISKIKNTGWFPRVTLHDGINKTYKWFLNNQHKKLNLNKNEKDINYWNNRTRWFIFSRIFTKERVFRSWHQRRSSLFNTARIDRLYQDPHDKS